MGKTVACIIARTVSKRLPLKVLRDIYSGVPMIDFLIKRVKKVECIDEIYLCTSTEDVDDILEDIAIRNEIKLYRGSPDAVIERMISVGDLESADIVLRITGDNPFTSTEHLNQQILFLKERSLDYVRLINVPLGATAEVISLKALKDCYARMDPNISEYLMLFLFEPKVYKCGVVAITERDYSNLSVTVDTHADLTRARILLTELKLREPLEIKLLDIIDVFGKVDLPSGVIEPSGMVKLPYDRLISYDEFSADMNRRKDSSLRLNCYE